MKIKYLMVFLITKINFDLKQNYILSNISQTLILKNQKYRYKFVFFPQMLSI